jgi:hypothetical protein
MSNDAEEPLKHKKKWLIGPPDIAVEAFDHSQ